MKKTFLIIIVVTLLSCTFKSCIRPAVDEPEESTFSPTILDRTTFENSVKSLPNQPIVKSGKIYIKDNLMFINEVNKGFHAYNYTNPEKPVRIGFIQILGATDLAIRDNTVYINQAVDLVTLEYNASSNSIAIKHRNKNVFPQKQSPDGTIANTTGNQIVVDWIQK
jgi:hypothetical protein